MSINWVFSIHQRRGSFVFIKVEMNFKGQGDFPSSLQSFIKQNDVLACWHETNLVPWLYTAQVEKENIV